MSSSYVRTNIKSFLDANSAEDYVDLTSHYEELSQLLAEEGIQPDAPWLGISFIGGQEIPVSLPATNVQGLYRETGVVQFHAVAVAAINVRPGLENRLTALQNLFRGQRIGDIVVDDMLVMNFDSGATLEFEAGYMSGTFSINYHRDLNL